MFSQLPQPLHYAKALFAHFTRLAGLGESRSLCQGLVESTSRLTDCDLSQLYLLDETHTRLTLTAEWHQNRWQTREQASLPSDYHREQLLQYCLLQNQVLAIDTLDSHLHDIAFLPESPAPWCSLLCLPLQSERRQVLGVLLVASAQPRRLGHFAESLGLLGNFAVGQLGLLNRLDAPATSAPFEPAGDRPCPSGYGLIGDSPAMRALYQMIGKVLHNPVNVLLTGETGTGKELVARAIHDYGSRRTRPFVVQNCASLPENLLESEMFGYRKGAFSGADRDHAGLLDAADTGTLFLDEIGDMPLSLQAKLLRVLQEGEVRPLGSTDTHKVDVRIIAATHRDLKQLVEAGSFREDLYYRLSHFPIELPPLQERGQDILQLARHFAEQACAFLQRPVCRWSQDAESQLLAYPFPGNVRELKGLIERAILLCDGNELLPEHFSLEGAASSNLNLRERLEQVERNLLIESLRRNQGNQTSAATELGLPRRTLLYRMQRLNICAAEVRAREKADARQ
ncbi:Fis family transcriptional regulator [Pseudomonas saudimassiliensis]|uniref:Fis family transcriptional regulator n=1 Tax=Pseudomonas saudimassiliensis TaxID=1461581 RepID=A0A078M821_9PSED|nr:sigma-54-dependent Fis family transcriptional regulator [Pseudomonas saudimassiliensis]CEA01532.1 Fis family transcriptional regulator [Pseudomonas saudimassiliensis]CEF25541.1 Fis family transcriptional regulator [Pseudomonas saudimassiliensis]